jgi:tRNA pseudouridine13 synthase
MKVKCQPQDFCVEELPLVRAEDAGRYTLYRLIKRSIGTMEAVEIIRRRWNLSARQVSYAGLKDRHAQTTQYLTITDGPDRSMSGTEFDLEVVGRVPAPYGPKHFRGNRFGLVVRDLRDQELPILRRELAAIQRDGLPNYFDDQRFGSVGYSGEFIGHAWLLGDHERALRLALAEANPFDRAKAKTQKAILRNHWGRWKEAKDRLDRSPTRSIVTYLVDHPSDFRGAFARLPREHRTLYFSAFQSHLWNLILARWLEHSTGAEERVVIELKTGSLPFPRGLTPERAQTLVERPIPLPSARNPLPTGRLGEVIQGVLEPFELTWPSMRVKYLKDVFFSKGTRAALVFPENLESAVLDDELHPGRRALRLSFELGKGSYATILIKRITEGAGPA